jgi:hypothetical protein
MIRIQWSYGCVGLFHDYGVVASQLKAIVSQSRETRHRCEEGTLFGLCRTELELEKALRVYLYHQP